MIDRFHRERCWREKKLQPRRRILACLCAVMPLRRHVRLSAVDVGNREASAPPHPRCLHARSITTLKNITLDWNVMKSTSRDPITEKQKLIITPGLWAV